jgi:hypothetical protein
MGAQWGWRSAFSAAAVLSALTFTAQFAALPALPPRDRPDLRVLAGLLGRPGVRVALLAVLLLISGHFAGFTYIRPLMEKVTHASVETVSVVLLGYGVGGFFGNFAGGWMAERSERWSIVAGGALIALLSFALLSSATSTALTAAAVALWGFAFGAFPIGFQTWIVRAAPDQAEGAGGLLVAAFQVAIASGAIGGGLLVDRVGPLGAPAFMAAAMVLGTWLTWRSGPRPQRAVPARERAMDERVNRRILLAARPHGLPTSQDFRLVTEPVPAPAAGEALLRTVHLSLDPYMRNLMDEVGPGYAPRVELGAPMVGATVSRVVASRHAGFAEGELVLANAGWQDYAVSDGTGLTPLRDMDHPSHALSGLGMPGFTAHVGLLDIGKPRAGETVVVAAATGAVGAIVGQLARLAGARVVGIAGGREKCAHAMQVLGFDACIDRHDPQLAAKLAAACPSGIDVYFENVGGAVLLAVLPLLNIGARVPVCGFIAHYNEARGSGHEDHLPALLAAVLQKRVHLQGFIILDHYGERFDAFQAQMRALVREGRVRIDEEVVAGLENAPGAFIDMLVGRHLGKLVVAVAD